MHFAADQKQLVTSYLVWLWTWSVWMSENLVTYGSNRSQDIRVAYFVVDKQHPMEALAIGGNAIRPSTVK